MNILEQALSLVDGDRQESYGDVTESHARIGKLWSCILPVTREITPQEVALCMMAMKISREISNHKDDNLVDIIGYTLCLDRIVQSLKAKELDDERTEAKA